MPKYLVIYNMHSVWAATGQEDQTSMQSFDDPDDARQWGRELFESFEECDEIHLYEYTGIQYVLIGRMIR